MERDRMKKPFRSFALLASVLSATVLMTGCATPEMPSDITLDELELKMAQAMDPAGKYRNAYAYFQRQNIEEEGLFTTNYQLVEVKFQHPDKFKFSYFEKNMPVTEILSIGPKAWFIDHKNNTVSEITGTALDKVKVMLALGHPDTDYDKLFSKVDIFLARQSGRDCYKLVCQPALENSNPIIIYVDKEKYLPIRMELTIKTADGEKNAISRIEKYQEFDQVKVPSLTKVEEGWKEYLTRVVDYQLNSHFKENEFKLPAFDPVLLENKKRRLERLR